MTHTIVQRAELVEVQAENTVHSDPDIADFHQAGFSSITHLRKLTPR